MSQNNYRSNCPDCFDLGDDCDTCLVVARSNQIIEGLKALMQSQPDKPLDEMAVEIEAKKVIADNDERKKFVINELRELAVEYSQLEFKTRRAVRTIQSYGKACKEAAEDFLEDGNVKELLTELGNIDETKATLKEASNDHNSIK
jgi:hypothetical protein